MVGYPDRVPVTFTFIVLPSWAVVSLNDDEVALLTATPFAYHWYLNDLPGVASQAYPIQLSDGTHSGCSQ
ncbi:hypothetical protein ASF62_11100 [Leifsonia sp. Leaf325]|nr:hypothetical protein ASF62_11100 [Leifsonia sp. Leaf325]